MCLLGGEIGASVWSSFFFFFLGGGRKFEWVSGVASDQFFGCFFLKCGELWGVLGGGFK